MDYYAKGSNIILRQSDFDLAQTLDCGQAFRWKYTGDIWQGFCLDRYLEISQNGDVFTFYNTSEQAFLEFWANYFDLYYDYGELKKRFSQTCPILKEACAKVGGIRILRQDFWETLISFIFSQQNNIPRIKKIIFSMCEMFFGFPSAETLKNCTVEDLAPLRSGFRAKYVLDAVRAFNSAEITEKALTDMSTSQAKAALMQIKGVGPKVASCVLLFSLHKTDAFPVDVWMERILREHYPNGFPQSLCDVGGIAQQYLFHYFRQKALGNANQANAQLV